MKVKWFVIFLFISGFVYSQNYSYHNYLDDYNILSKFNIDIKNNNIDSLKYHLNNYKNRLGFTYYKCKALIANHDSNSIQFNYIDSAFMRGMTPLCIDTHLKKFDSLQIYQSFKKNYLKSYNLKLINLVDSIHYKDQEYRQQIDFEYKHPFTPVMAKKKLDSDKKISFNKNNQQELIDSLWKLQKHTDSTNFIKLNEIINMYGWPSSILVGDYYCQRPGPDVTMLIIHLGDTKRDFQIATLKKVIELCENHEESWQYAEALIGGLHSKFSRNFSEFCFLVIKKNHLFAEESFFSIYNMSKILINSAGKIEIKCAKISLFDELKKAMLDINEILPIDSGIMKIREKYGMPPIQKFDKNSFLFIESTDLKDDVILYKISKK